MFRDNALRDGDCSSTHAPLYYATLSLEWGCLSLLGMREGIEEGGNTRVLVDASLHCLEAHLIVLPLDIKDKDINAPTQSNDCSLPI